MPIKDKEARRDYNSKYQKQWYKKNKKKKKEQAKRSRKRAIRRNRRYVENYKLEHPCPTCSETEPCCLSFHHLNGDDKEGNISDMVNRGYSIARIQKEIDKCHVMCLNCHAKLHNKEKEEEKELAVAAKA